MLTAKILTDENQDDWDNYVIQHEMGTPYHLFAWGKAIERAYNHKSYQLVVLENGQLQGILPLVHMKRRLSHGALVSLPFCDVGGILAESREAMQLLREQAFNLAEKLSVSQLTMRQQLKQTVFDDIAKIDELNPASLQNKKVRMLMSMPNSADDLLSSFKSKLRSQIRKAEKNGLTSQLGNQPKDIEEFYSVFCRNMHKLGSPTHSLKWFQEIQQNYGDNIIIGRTIFKNKTVGAGILLFTPGNTVIPWASTLSDYNRLAPNMLLYWSLLQNTCERQCPQFDFGRSTYGEGTFKFKSQWGAEPRLLDWKSYTEGGKLIEDTSKGKSALRPLVEKAWSKLPLKIANSVGPSIRKHISL